MKKLILVRHAKSDWPEETSDFDRPLAEEGKQDAHKMSEFLKSQNIRIEKLVTSPALRAMETCKIFQKNLHLDFTTDEKLYNPSEKNFLSVIDALQDEHHAVALFSHNNGISNFANSLTDEIFHFPTCGVVGFNIHCDAWAEFDGAEKSFDFFFEPKKI